jgi:hypothetical protein
LSVEVAAALVTHKDNPVTNPLEECPSRFTP